MSRLAFKSFDATARRLRGLVINREHEDFGKFLGCLVECGVHRSYASPEAMQRRRLAKLLSYLSGARAHRSLHDFAVYRERIRAAREGRKERYIPYFNQLAKADFAKAVKA